MKDLRNAHGREQTPTKIHHAYAPLHPANRAISRGVRPPLGPPTPRHDLREPLRHPNEPAGKYNPARATSVCLLLAPAERAPGSSDRRRRHVAPKIRQGAMPMRPEAEVDTTTRGGADPWLGKRPAEPGTCTAICTHTCTQTWWDQCRRRGEKRGVASRQSPRPCLTIWLPFRPRDLSVHAVLPPALPARRLGVKRF